ncbi:MAG: TonB-dependent receptor domain-containing protein, partial [Gammaproteobacteria bacterium]
TMPDADESPGTLENSNAEAENFNAGASLVGERGYLGFSIGYLDNNFGVPGAHHHHEEGEEEDAEEEEEGGTRIDIEQTRYDVAGSYRVERAHVHEVRTRWGYNDYQHDEVEGSGEVGTRFSNEEWEGRVEVLLEPIGPWDVAVGGQFRDQDFSALGEEAFVAPAALDSQAGFVFGKAEFGPVHVDLGARYEDQDAVAKQGGARASHGLFSFSGGGVYGYAPGFEVGMSYARSERAPTIEELFAGGPHLASNTFEIGDAGLDEEVSNNVDVFWRKTDGRYRFDFTLFYNHVDDFVYLASNDLNGDGIADRVEDDFGATGEIVDEDDALLLVNQRQQGAEFWGFELEGRMALFDDTRGRADLRLWTDYVNGELDDGSNVPRLPPLRFGGNVDYSRGPWYGRFAVTRVTDQDDSAPLETDTDGYTMVDIDVGYVLYVAGRGEVTLFARGTNLADETARRHTSFVKDLAPLPGRSGLIGVRARF